MATSPKRVYWDACAWIALIQMEKVRDKGGVITEDRETMCKAVIYEAEEGNIEIVTSAFSLVEVCKDPGVKNNASDKIAAYFEHDFVLLANLDRFVGERARELMRAGYSKLKPPDASHLATAAIANVDEMQTFDGKLLDLDGLITKANGTKLKITKPGPSGAPLPLLELTQRANGATDGATASDRDLTSEEIAALEELERAESSLQDDRLQA